MDLWTFNRQNHPYFAEYYYCLVRIYYQGRLIAQVPTSKQEYYANKAIAMFEGVWGYGKVENSPLICCARQLLEEEEANLRKFFLESGEGLHIMETKVHPSGDVYFEASYIPSEGIDALLSDTKKDPRTTLLHRLLPSIDFSTEAIVMLIDRDGISNNGEMVVCIFRYSYEKPWLDLEKTQTL